VFEMESLVSMLNLGHASTVEQLAAQMVQVDHLRSIYEEPGTRTALGELLRIAGLVHLQGDSWRTISSALTQLRLQLRLRVIEGRAGKKEPVTPQEEFVEAGHVSSVDLLQIIGGYAFQDADTLAMAHQWINESPQDAQACATASRRWRGRSRRCALRITPPARHGPGRVADRR
jgi:hypothetical protein